MSGRKARFPAARAAKLIAALVIVLSLALAWKVTPLSQYLDSKTVEATIAGFASSPWAPLYVIRLPAHAQGDTACRS
jgi:hypothetical protein